MAICRNIYFMTCTFSLMLFIIFFRANLQNETDNALRNRGSFAFDLGSIKSTIVSFTEYRKPTEPAKRLMANCSKGKELVGPLFVNKERRTWEQLKEELGYVKDGGHYSPLTCRPTEKVAIIIPYRDREEHLKLLLRQLYPMLKRQNICYQMFVVEQADDSEFNRGKLMNVGFAEAVKRSDFNCFIFHDVDLIPEDDRIFYGCPHSPMHLSVAIDKFHYKLVNEDLFGGVVMFKKDDFTKINGFSNSFWLWGGEDDNLRYRVRQHGLSLFRPSVEKARYQMLKHVEAPKKHERFIVLKEASLKINVDGLNSLIYEVKDTLTHALYTKIKVDLLKNSM